MISRGGEQPRFSGGRRVHDPLHAARVEMARQHIYDALHYFMEGLPIGKTGDAPEAVAYQQPDGQTCFYAALGGVATSLHGRVFDIRALGGRARSEGLLNQYGAVTFSESQGSQAEFVRREMNVVIRFINSVINPDQQRIDALTTDLRRGRPIVFGLYRHWVALDGFKKNSHDHGQATWTGMNPAGARRLESEPRTYLTPQLVAARLIAGDLPVVVVEGINKQRFRRAEPTPTPRFVPLGRRGGNRVV
ncbi:MAG TPA: hypothetical protein VFB03_00885 [Candidatus Saccharimonadales bacterium]|nr:hypothetical protein [Candidatus Saccharimonadales bacterium]